MNPTLLPPPLLPPCLLAPWAPLPLQPSGHVTLFSPLSLLSQQHNNTDIKEGLEKGTVGSCPFCFKANMALRTRGFEFKVMSFSVKWPGSRPGGQQVGALASNDGPTTES